MSHTVWIRNAEICDGSGGKPCFGDIVIRDGVISEIGTETSRPDSAEVVDAEGLLACPGFIDAHAHSDLSLLAAPEAYGKISQGITTEISGNCGLSAFPVLTEEVREHLQELYSRYGVSVDWTDFESYARALESRHPAINAGFLCGHNTLRANVLGYKDVPNTREDWRKMKTLLEKMLDQGALGMSTGLLYVPGKFSSREELRIVAGALKSGGAPYATHLRSEGSNLLEALEEALEIAGTGANHLHISHLKTAGRDNWFKLDAVFERLERARKSGMRVTGDRYPYTFGQTSLSVILPPPYDAMTDSAIEVLLRREPHRQKELTEELNTLSLSWDRILLCGTRGEIPERFFGRSLEEIAEIQGKSPSQLCVDLLSADGGTLAAFGGMSEENMLRILDDPAICCGTDETARPRDYSLGRSHPRGFGSFARFIHFERMKYPKEEIIRKLTSFPALIFGISDRGELKPGKAADLLLLDWDCYKDRASYGSPHTSSDGVKRVYVNGCLSFEGGKIRDSAGKIIKKGKKVKK